LQFKTGVLNNDGHLPGDIIVCMCKSFLNRHSKGNMNLDQCKFIAIDEIDDIYNMDKDSLEQLLKIVKNSKASLISCSATMEKSFLKFYESCDPDYIPLNITQELEKETGQKVTLEGVKNYRHAIKCEEGSKKELYNFILKDVFKQLYTKNDEKKPQVFIFFNSVD
jgi:superfamily II DNA/RNA helicase